MLSTYWLLTAIFSSTLFTGASLALHTSEPPKEEEPPKELSDTSYCEIMRRAMVKEGSVDKRRKWISCEVDDVREVSSRYVDVHFYVVLDIRSFNFNGIKKVHVVLEIKKDGSNFKKIRWMPAP